MVFVLIFLSFENLSSHPYTRDLTFDKFYETKFQFDYSNFYNVQYGFDFTLMHGYGYYKNVDETFMKLVFGLRYSDNLEDFKFRFLLLEIQGLASNPIGYKKDKNNYTDTNGCEYLFLQPGITLVDWNKTGFIISDFNAFRLSLECLFEPRYYTRHHLYGLPYRAGNNNVYLSSSFNAGLTKLSFDSTLLKMGDINSVSFWDLETGVKLELVMI